MYLLRNETPNEQIRNSLDEVTCFLEMNSADYPEDSVVTTEATANNHGYVKDESEDGDGYDDDDQDEDVVDVKYSRHLGTPAIVSTKVPGGIKHLFEIALEALPCPEDAPLETNGNFDSDVETDFGYGQDMSPNTGGGARREAVAAIFVLNAIVVLLVT